ncbi:TonB-dependent receptor [Hyphococcus flavus]|uniref:TonB-dependent receptor n=1 Tax=Hyphococcus flavus TaxID=1866326 RepID=A0AAE9ZBN0_9PROT|nr:TonB-dependent receptor [Hyphococcus flavus]WDI31688.1 TonB-dependent receptor [Hyphococcus flavus]
MAVGASSANANDSIVVTAERRDEPLQRVPQSISVVSREEIVLINADHIAEILAGTPGVNIHRGSGAEHLTAIRSPVLTGGAGAGSFLFLENGVPIRSAGFANINGLFDAHYEIAERIETVRGPSGALYGANAIHGVINVITPSPTDDLSFFGEAFGDTEDRYKWKATISDTNNRHGFLAAASVTSESGYREDAGLDQQKASLRHVFQQEDVQIDTIFSLDNLEQETAGFIFGEAALNDRELRRMNDFPQARRDAKSSRLQSTISIATSENSSLKITPYARWNDMEFVQHFFPGNALEENGHWSAGIQSAYYHDEGPLSIIVGIDAEYTEGSLREFQEEPTIFSFTQGLHYDYEVTALNASGFAQTSYAFSDNTKAIAAIRIDGTIYDYTNNMSSGVDGRFFRPSDQKNRFVTASPKFSLLHRFSDNDSVYASYARGARPPQTTDLYRLQSNQIDNPARPETIDALELGVRGAIGEKIRYDLAGFWMNKKNFFFRDADGFNVPNGETRHVGVEADINIDLHPTLSLASAFTYARHTYRFERLTGTLSETIRFGDDADTAPRIIANTRLSWRPLDRLSFNAEWVSMGSYFTDAANSRSYEGHNLLHLRTEVAVTDELSVFGVVRNATNALYAERADFAFGNDRYFPGEERVLGFGIRYR